MCVHCQGHPDIPDSPDSPDTRQCSTGPPRLCTDNGVMVAWAAVEQLHLGRAHVAEGQEVRARWPLGPPVPGARPDAGVAKGGGGGGGKRAKPAAAASTALGA